MSTFLYLLSCLKQDVYKAVVIQNNVNNTCTPTVKQWWNKITLLANIYIYIYIYISGIGSGGGGGGGRRRMCQGGLVIPHLFDFLINGMFVPPTFNPTFLFSTWIICLCNTDNYLASFIYQLIILWKISITIT